ncbi:MAG: hypothetical protein ACP5N7_04155 [Candidatus Pacearchaeota archaeon]
MKILIILLFFITLSCNDKTVLVSNSVSLIRDVTDPLAAVPTSDPILLLFNLSEHNDGEAIFRYREISGISRTPVETIRLTNNRELEKKHSPDESMGRQKNIIRFYEKIRSVISTADTVNKNQTQKFSECFRTIANELEVLTKQHTTSKTLIIFSNLFEKSDIFSCYDRPDRFLLEKRPTEVAGLFSKTKLLPSSLNGITVIIIYQPISRDTDILFSQMVEVYTQLLKSRGATVHIQAEPKQFQL